jgi:hypothetical protein
MVFQVAFPPAGAASEGSEVIVAGAFTNVGSTHAGRIARRRNGAWEAIGPDLPGAVLALAWANDAIYVSTEPAEPPKPRHLLLGRWDGRSWTEVATPENGLPAPREETVHSIRDLLAVGRHVIAAGSIWPVTGGRNVYVFDGARFTALGGGVDAISVNSIALAPDALWFGGQIAEVGAAEAQAPSVGIARFKLPDASDSASR